jgi:uncharacterized protein (TIGR03067 family)
MASHRREMGQVLVSLLMVPVLSEAMAQGEIARLQGTWVLTDATGTEIPAGAHKALVIKGDKYEGVTNGTTDERGTIKLNSGMTPWSIDLIVAEGRGPLGIQLGLVEVSGNSMTLALSETGQATRPAGLSGEKISLTKIQPIDKRFEGAWQGAITAGGRTLRLGVKLANGADGLASGTIVSIDQGGDEGPITAVVQMGARLRLIVPVVRGTYDGELRDGELVGTWRQGRNSTPLTLKRVNLHHDFLARDR